MNDLEIQKTNVGRELAIVSIVFGLAAFFLVVLPSVGIWAMAAGVLAFLFAIVGLLQARKSNGKKALLVAAMLISSASVIFVFVYCMFFAAGINATEKTDIHKVIEHTETVLQTDSLAIDSIQKKELENTLREFEDGIGD